jgi:RND family efflux transporter MFP subunit
MLRQQKLTPSRKSRLARALVPLTLLCVPFLLLDACTRARVAEKRALDLPAVSVSHPSAGNVQDVFSVIGSVQAVNEVTILSETSGRIIEMPAKTGAVVSRDQPLVFVDKDLREAAFIAAEAAYAKAGKDSARVAALHADKLASDADLEAAQLAEASARAQYLVARKELENTTVRATIAGTIADTFVSLGEQIGMGSRIALVVDASRLKVRVMLPERTALRLRAGDAVAVTSELFPGRSFAGRIDSVSVRGDETHSFPTEVVLLGNAAADLRAGMSVRLRFGGNNARLAILIPRAAIVGSVRDPEVFVVVDGAAERRKIVVGEEHGTDIEVLSGLGEADNLVTSGQTLLSDHQAVRIVEPGTGI